MHKISIEDLIIKNNYEGAICAGVYEGLPIFPVESDTLSKRYKAPLTRAGFKDASSIPEQIEQWWTQNPNAMVGLATGQKSGIVAIDVDIKKVDGISSLKDLEEKLGKLPETFTVKTITGGLHLCFKAPEDREIPCSANGKTGIDFRGDGGYIVYADSENSEGKRYEIIKPLPMAELPQSYIEFFQTKQAKETAELKDGLIPEGGRNDGLTSLVGTFLNKGVTGGHLYKLAHMMNQQICSPPLPDWEVDNIVESIGKRDREN